MIIYRITNKINGKPYIGQTTRTLEERIYEHRHCKTTTLGKAIQKYGWENFTVEILEVCETLEQLNEREKFWIAKYNSIAPNGYNLTEGGNNGLFSDEVCLKISVANTGKKRSAETCKRISESKTGTKMPEKTRALMSAMRKGKPKSDEARANMKLAQAKNRKCVRCIETGEVFSSIRKAAEKYGIDHKNIGRACKKSTRTALGMHWEFVN